MRRSLANEIARGCKRAIAASISIAQVIRDWRIARLLALACLVTGSVSSATGQERARTAPGKSQAGRIELRDMARRAYENAVVDRQVLMVTMEDVCRWSRRWLDQELALAASDEDKLVAIKAHLGRIQHLAQHESRQIEVLEYYLTEAELMLAEIRPDPKFEATVAARKALQGTWRVISAEQKGAKVESQEWEWDTIEVVGRKITLSSSREGSSGWGLLTLDPTRGRHDWTILVSMRTSGSAAGESISWKAVSSGCV